jgi:hypothetical protein
VKTKETKLQFLGKVLDYLKMSLQMHVDLRPSKVVAGLEPEKTCYFLQLLATLALHQVDVDHVSSKKGSSVGGHDEGDELMNDVDKHNIAKATNVVAEQESKDEPYLATQDNEKAQTKLIEAEQKEETEEGKSIEADSRPTSTKIEDEEKSPENLSDEKKENYNDEVKLTDHVVDLRFDVHRKETAIDDESNADGSDIQHRFFGTNEYQEEMIIDDSKRHFRPKTARRRPPRVKERIPLADSMDLSTEIKKPFIFKDNENDDVLLNLNDRSQKLDKVGR